MDLTLLSILVYKYLKTCMSIESIYYNLLHSPTTMTWAVKNPYEMFGMEELQTFYPIHLNTRPLCTINI